MADLETLQANYLRLQKQADPQYLAITEELGRRRSGSFDVERTVSFLREQAKLGRFVSYKDLSDHFGIPWSAARRPIAQHLDAVCDYAHGKGWPLLSAIVVNKENLATGKLEPEALLGFMRTANRLNFFPQDGEVFLKEQQHLVRNWAREGVIA